MDTNKRGRVLGLATRIFIFNCRLNGDQTSTLILTLGLGRTATTASRHGGYFGGSLRTWVLWRASSALLGRITSSDGSRRRFGGRFGGRCRFLLLLRFLWWTGLRGRLFGSPLLRRLGGRSSSLHRHVGLCGASTLLGFAGCHCGVELEEVRV